MIEIYTLVSEVHDKVDMVLGIKNFAELEAEFGRSVPIFPVHQEIVKPKERRLRNIEVPFLDEIPVIQLMS